MKTPPRILVVEDERVFNMLLERTLTAEGYLVKCAFTGEQALAMMKREKFDLIITDLNMPRKDGIETILELSGSLPDLKIIAMSGGGLHGAKDYLPLASILGADRTLAKPFKKELLIRIVREEIGAPSSSSEE